MRQDIMRNVEHRNDTVRCTGCQAEMRRILSAPLFRFAGRVVSGGGPDRFTADVLGVPLKDLPAGLKTEK
jgi:hypothetical protein